MRNITALQKVFIISGCMIAISSFFATFNNLYPFLQAIAPTSNFIDINNDMGIINFNKNIKWLILFIGICTISLGITFNRIGRLWVKLSAIEENIGKEVKILSFNICLLLVFIFALSIRLVCLKFSDNVHIDGVLKIYDALRWMKNPHLITQGVWAPLQTYLISLSLFIYNNVLISPVLMNLFLAALIVFPFSYLVRKEFGDQVAIYSAIIYSLYPIAFRHSLLSFSEIPFNFFMFLSLSLLFVSKGKNNKAIYIFLAATFLNCASMLRYEGWALIPVLSLFLIDDKRSFLLFFITSMIFPVFWMMGNYIEFKDPLFSINYAQRLNLIGHKVNEGYNLYSFLVRVLFWPMILIMGLTPLIALFAICGVSMSIYKYNHLKLLFLLLFLLSIFMWKSQTGTMNLKSRYSIVLAMFLIPYSAYALSIFLSTIKNSIIRFGISAMVLLSILPFSYAGGKVTEGLFFLPRAPHKYQKIAQFLNDKLDVNDNIIVDHFGDWKEGYITLYTGRTYEKAYQVTGPEHKISTEEIKAYVEDQKPKFMVTSQSGRLNIYVENDNRFLKYAVKRLFEAEDLRIYRFYY